MKKIKTSNTTILELKHEYAQMKLLFQNKINYLISNGIWIHVGIIFFTILYSEREFEERI